MKWSELSIATLPEYVEPLSEVFRRYGEGGVVVEEQSDWDPDDGPLPPGPPTSVTVRTYLPQDATYRNRKAMIEVGIKLVSLLQPLGELQERFLKEDEWEWAWKSHFTLLRVGRRLVVKASWQEYTPRKKEAVVELDPGMAFGTGHHPTTWMCLEQIEKRVEEGMRVLDLGTGSGILCIAAIKLGAGRAVALDSDSIAVSSARANFRANGLGRRVKLIHGTVPHGQVAAGSFELAVANVTAKVIVDKAQALGDSLAPGGVLVVSGIIQERLGEAEAALAQASLVHLERQQDGDWVTLVMGRGQH